MRNNIVIHFPFFLLVGSWHFKFRLVDWISKWNYAFCFVFIFHRNDKNNNGDYVWYCDECYCFLPHSHIIPLLSNMHFFVVCVHFIFLPKCKCSSLSLLSPPLSRSRSCAIKSFTYQNGNTTIDHITITRIIHIAREKMCARMCSKVARTRRIHICEFNFYCYCPFNTISFFVGTRFGLIQFSFLAVSGHRGRHCQYFWKKKNKNFQQIYDDVAPNAAAEYEYCFDGDEWGRYYSVSIGENHSVRNTSIHTSFLWTLFKWNCERW